MLPKPIWYQDGKVCIIEQTKLPVECSVREIKTAEEMWDAIKRLEVRGAPAIGLAGAFGIYLGICQWLTTNPNPNQFVEAVHKTADYLDSARPTAVNLHWACTRMKNKAAEVFSQYQEGMALNVLEEGMLEEARKMLEEDIATCRAIGEYGADILSGIEGFTGFLTHCNAGALATSMYGTALAPAYVLQERGVPVHVYSDETRPLLQGSRLTAWELSQSGIPVTTICDNMAGVVMRKGWVQAVITGADRITLNGDTANKIGTYSVAILAKEHGIPFYIAAPLSTIDFSMKTGEEIPIEQRDPEEVRNFGLRPTAPKEAEIFNPAFDVTPNQYITGIITEKGVAYPPYEVSLPALRDGKQIDSGMLQSIRTMRQSVLKTAKTMLETGLVSASFGNVSMLDKKRGLVAITPSGLFYRDMEEEDITIVDMEGNFVPQAENRHKPSSELPLHLEVYKRREDIRAIVHTHSLYATTLSILDQPIPPVISEMGVVSDGDVPVAKYANPGTPELAQFTADALGNGYGCLMANHGVLACADNIDRAYMAAAIIEDGAKVFYLAKQAGSYRTVPEEAYQKVFEAMKAYGREAEKE